MVTGNNAGAKNADSANLQQKKWADERPEHATVDPKVVMKDYTSAMAIGMKALQEHKDLSGLSEYTEEMAALIRNLGDMALAIVAHNHGISLQPTSIKPDKARE